MCVIGAGLSGKLRTFYWIDIFGRAFSTQLADLDFAKSLQRVFVSLKPKKSRQLLFSIEIEPGI